MQSAFANIVCQAEAIWKIAIPAAEYQETSSNQVID
jgi:hypothetical protein